MGDLGNKKVFSENLNYYMNKFDKERNDICRDLGFKYSTFSDWINGNKYPRIDNIEIIANYFGIQKSDLIEKKNNDFENINAHHPSHLYKIPIYGTIHAGPPMFAEECIEGYEFADVPTPNDYFYLRVRGDSMINARIQDDDIVLVHRQPVADNGQIVACIINGDEATLKRFRRLDTAIMLQPDNPSYDPIIVPLSDFDNGYAKILGVVERVMFSVI